VSVSTSVGPEVLAAFGSTVYEVDLAPLAGM